MAYRVRTGLLALAVTFSAGLHAGLVPEHLKEMPQLGYGFMVASAIGGVLAVMLIWRPDERRIWMLAGLFCLGQIAAWGLLVTVHVPFFSGTPEPVEAIALVSKTIEALGVAIAVSLVASRHPRSVPTRAGRPRRPPSGQRVSAH